jgi:hypothetical protein
LFHAKATKNRKGTQGCKGEILHSFAAWPICERHSSLNM